MFGSVFGRKKENKNGQTTGSSDNNFEVLDNNSANCGSSATGAVIYPTILTDAVSLSKPS
jgi:hypothetical protein